MLGDRFPGHQYQVCNEEDSEIIATFATKKLAEFFIGEMELEEERDRLYRQIDLVERQMSNLGKQLADAGREIERLRRSCGEAQDK